jgi:hypothetical protein
MEKLNKIQSELRAPKLQRNSFGKYNYRSCEDILEAVKPLLSKYNCTLTVSDEIKQAGDIMYVEAVAIISDGENQIHTKAQAGIDINRKGMDIAQSFGSSSSYARKYALNGLFLIDDTKDADATNDHSTKVVAEKKWLNKDTPEFIKAQAYLKGGGNISNIEAKYRISNEVKELLNK